jgi:hypothetical protein
MWFILLYIVVKHDPLISLWYFSCMPDVSPSAETIHTKACWTDGLLALACPEMTPFYERSPTAPA